MTEPEKLIAEFSLAHPAKAKGLKIGYDNHHPDRTLSVAHLLDWYTTKLVKAYKPGDARVSPFANEDALPGSARLSFAIKDAQFTDLMAAGDHKGAAQFAADAVQQMAEYPIGQTLDAAFTAPAMVNMSAHIIKCYVEEHYQQMKAQAGGGLTDPPSGSRTVRDQEVEDVVRAFLKEHPEHVTGIRVMPQDAEVMPGELVADPPALAAFTDWVTGNGLVNNLEAASRMRKTLRTKYGV